MRNITLTDDLFDLNITSSYHLSVLVHSRGVSYAILDTVRVKFLAFKNIWFEEALQGEVLLKKLEQIFTTDAYINRNYKKLSLVYCTPRATIIPAPMYDSADRDRFTNLFGPPQVNEILIDNYTPSADSFLLFAIPESFYNLASNNLDTPQFIHQSNPMIESALLNSKGNMGKSKVYATVYPQFMDVVVIHDGEFKLYNAFPYKSSKDLAFYILYLYDQFQLSNEHIALELSGLIEDQGELHQLLKNYLRQIYYQEFNRSYSYSYVFNELTQHHFANLVNTFRCE